METSRKYAAITFFAALALLVPSYVAVFQTGAPTLLSPLPALTIIPAMFLGRVAFLMPALYVLLWCHQFARGVGRIPKRTTFLFGLFVILSALDFRLSWKWGLQYQGPKYTIMVCIINVAWILVLGISIWRLRKTATFLTSLLFHWTLFVWLSWYALPWLGEFL